MIEDTVIPFLPTDILVQMFCLPLSNRRRATSKNTRWCICRIGVGVPSAYRRGGYHTTPAIKGAGWSCSAGFLAYLPSWNGWNTYGPDIRNRYPNIVWPCGEIDRNAWSERTEHVLHQFMNMTGRQYGFLQTNNEECIKPLPARGIHGIGDVAIRHAPTYSSQSQGPVAGYRVQL